MAGSEMVDVDTGLECWTVYVTTGGSYGSTGQYTGGGVVEPMSKAVSVDGSDLGAGE